MVESLNADFKPDTFTFYLLFFPVEASSSDEVLDYGHSIKLQADPIVVDVTLSEEVKMDVQSWRRSLPPSRIKNLRLGIVNESVAELMWTSVGADMMEGRGEYT